MTADLRERHLFDFARHYRLPALVFGVTPATAWVDLGPTLLKVRFGPWRLNTPISNIAGTSRSRGFSFLKTAGPAHLSFADRGITFATSAATEREAVCVSFHDHVRAIDPIGVIRHPGATLTLRDPVAFERAVHELITNP